MSKVISWVTPFSKIEFPSVGMFVEHGEFETDLIRAIVAPKGIDDYPKYLVNFGSVYEVLLYEEGCSPTRGYEALLDDVKGESTCEWLTSPSVNSYQALECEGSLKHFIIFGGDNVLEVVTKNKPKITKISQPTIMDIRLNV